MGHFGEASEIYFSAENDDCELNYQARLDLSLTEYNAKWLSLGHVPSS